MDAAKEAVGATVESAGVQLQSVGASMISGGFTDRVTTQKGATVLKNPAVLGLVMNAEVKDVNCCVKAILCCACLGYDLERSYLYVRENSIESNLALSVCCGMCDNIDTITVQYFDRPPYQPCCCDNCMSGKPEVRVLDMGCMICCQLCCSDKVYVIASPKMIFPCCCCPNATSGCDNCFGLCGPVLGNPKCYQSAAVQPKDADKFVEAVTSVLATFTARGAPPDAETMEDRD